MFTARRLYEKIGAFFPDMPISQFNTRYDEVQAQCVEGRRLRAVAVQE